MRFIGNIFFQKVLDLEDKRMLKATIFLLCFAIFLGSSISQTYKIISKTNDQVKEVKQVSDIPYYNLENFYQVAQGYLSTNAIGFKELDFSKKQVVEICPAGYYNYMKYSVVIDEITFSFILKPDTTDGWSVYSMKSDYKPSKTREAKTRPLKEIEAPKRNLTKSKQQ